MGKGAELLGLNGEVHEKEFIHLCAGEKPDGSMLTQRMNTVREGDTPNRRVFYDWMIAPPKSVSVAALVGGDDRILKAHAKAVAIAAKELEKYATARVRAKGDSMNGKDRATGNLTMAAFTHETSRAVSAEQVGDPQLHTHLLVFNCTQDPGDNDKWKALQNYEMLKNQRFISSVYDYELCRELKKMGYAIRSKGKGWELDHIPTSLCDKFSKRHSKIEETTAELEASGAKSGHEKLKNRVAHSTRMRKTGSQEAEELRESWQAQMTASELEALKSFGKTNEPVRSESPKETVAWTKKHLFERNAVVTQEMFLTTCLKHTLGTDYSVEDYRKALMADKSFLHEIGTTRMTTKEALATEKFLLDTVRGGKGKYEPLGELLPITLTRLAHPLNETQLPVAEKLLSSSDFCTVFRGGAGTGKSFSLQHVEAALILALKAKEKKVVVLAPQNKQVIGLIGDEFDAYTVSTFLHPASSISVDKDTVVLVDEAGQIGGKSMQLLMEKVKAGGGRIILSGDTKQKGPVEASDAMRAIENYADPTTAALEGEYAIQRQQTEQYKSAVAAASRGDTSLSWKILDEMGSIVDTTLADKNTIAAKAFVQRMGDSKEYNKETKTGGNVLMLSQTNAEVEALNLAIREELAKVGKLDLSASFDKETLKTVDMTDAEKECARYYPDDAVLVLNMNIGSTKAGAVAKFVREDENRGIVISVDGKERKVKEEELKSITVCVPTKLNLTAGDKVQLKANIKYEVTTKLKAGETVTFAKKGKDDNYIYVKASDGKVYSIPASSASGELKKRSPLTITKNITAKRRSKLANGQIMEVVKQEKDGALVVVELLNKKPWYGKKFTIASDFKMLKHGYAVTSYGSQGETVDHVLMSDSMCKACLTTEDWYVSTSRGKWSCSIFTADREALQDHIQHLGQRENASDLKLERDKVPVKPVKRPLVPSVERLGLREVNLNTSNTDKLREFDKLGLNIVGMTSVDLKEPASDAWRVVAYKAAQVPENTLVEDTSLDIEGADVGVNVKWQLENMDQYIGKRATFRVILGMVENGKVCHYLGEVHGQIVPPRGNAGFGFDKYFLPDGAKQTLANAKPHQYNARALAIENFNAGKVERETDPIPVWHGEWQGELEKDIERPDELSAFLGDPGAKAAHPCIDVSTGKKVELFGSLDAHNWAVRGFAELQNICVKGIGMLRGILREREKVAEVERQPVQVPVRAAEIEHER